MNNSENKDDGALHNVSRGRLKKRILIGGVAVLLLVSGMVIGGGITVIHMKRIYTSINLPQSIGERLYTRLLEQAKLDDSQKAQIKSIIDMRFKSIEQIRELSINDIRSEFESLRDEVAEHLQPDDAIAWNQRMDFYINKFVSGQK